MTRVTREPGEDPVEFTQSCWICEKCGDKTSGCLPTALGRICPKCNFKYVIRPAASSPDDLCVEPGCGLTVRQHMEQIRAYVAKIDERNQGL